MKFIPLLVVVLLVAAGLMFWEAYVLNEQLSSLKKQPVPTLKLSNDTAHIRNCKAYQQ